MKYIYVIFLFCTCNAQLKYDIKNINWINSDNGFKQSSAKYCVSDKNGMLWIGTEMGLYRYDGAFLKQIIDDNFPDINKERISNLVTDFETGDIVFSTYPSKGLYRINNNVVKKIPDNNEKFCGIITDNYMCFFSADLIKKMRKYCDNSEYSNFIFSNKGCRNNKYFYLPSKYCIYVFNQNGDVSKLNYSVSDYLTLLKFDENIILFDRKKIGLIVKNRIITKNLKTDKIIHSFINDTYINPAVFFNKALCRFGNEYYINYKGRIYQILYKNSRLESKLLFNVPCDDILLISHNKKEDIFFLGTLTKGLGIIKPKIFNTIYFKNADLNNCYSVAEIRKDEWFSTTGWKYNTKNKKVSIDTSFPQKNKFFLFKYDNNFYHTNEKNDLVDFNNVKIPFSFNKESSYFTGYCFMNNMLWVSDTKKVFFEFKKRLVLDNYLESKLMGLDIFQLFNFNNNLIIGTSKGVFIYQPFLKKIKKINGLENVYARYFKKNDENSFWVGCYGEGLFLVSNNRAHRIKDKNFDFSTAHALEEDTFGNLWISTNDGLLSVNKNETIKRALNNKRIECYRYSIFDGLLTNEFNGGGSFPSLKNHIGVIGFPSMKGFVWFHPEIIKKNLFTGKIIIDEVYEDGVQVKSVKNVYYISNKSSIISVKFSFPYYFNRENLSIEYRLNGDFKWIETKENKINFARQKNGNKQLFIRIRTHDLVQRKDVIQSVLFDFEDKYYETYWFAVLCFLLIIVFGYFGFLLGKMFYKYNLKILSRKVAFKTKQLDEKILELALSKKNIEKSLKEKEILLKEIHHRVKNNLQLISSILNIQGRREKNENVEHFLARGQNRIASISLIHRVLYQSGELKSVNFQEYISTLCFSIKDSFGEFDKRIVFNINAHNISLNLQTAIPLGLVLNELITNTLKYAFPEIEEGTINIEIHLENQNEYQLIYEDNGIGFNKDIIQKKSFGIELIKLLVQQIEGDIKFDCVLKGTKYIIRFKELEN